MNSRLCSAASEGGNDAYQNAVLAPDHELVHARRVHCGLRRLKSAIRASELESVSCSPDLFSGQSDPVRIPVSGVALHPAWVVTVDGFGVGAPKHHGVRDQDPIAAGNWPASPSGTKHTLDAREQVSHSKINHAPASEARNKRLQLAEFRAAHLHIRGMRVSSQRNAAASSETRCAVCQGRLRTTS
jgi:hypothetical protein